MTDKPVKPIQQPDPTATPAEWRKYAEANAAWSEWIKAHPEDDAQATEKP